MTIRSRFVALPLALALGVGVVIAPPVAEARTLPQLTHITKTRALGAPSSLGAAWKRIAKLTYGTATKRLGTSAGREGMNWGPSYGTQLPNGTWWYADAAKLRLAHYSAAGKYLGQAKLPTAFLNSGVYFQWQNPQALANGTVVMSSTTIDSPGLMKYRHGTFSRVTMSSFVTIVINDGRYLYGFDEADQMVRVDPANGKITPTTWFYGQGARKFKISVATGSVTVTRPKAEVRINLTSAAHPAGTVHPAVQAAMGADGKLWVLVSAIVEYSVTDSADAVGLFSISTSGKLSKTYPVRHLSSDADPGDGHNLGIRKGSTHPWLMFIDTDAVRVYRMK